MEANVLDQIELIPGDSSHHAFIYATWLRSYKHGSSFAKRIKDHIFYNRHHVIIERILGRPKTAVTVVHLKDDPDTLLAYLVTEEYATETIIHFCYVKLSFREMGIGRELINYKKLNPNTALYSHRTFMVEWIERKYPGLTYDPYLI